MMIRTTTMETTTTTMTMRPALPLGKATTTTLTILSTILVEQMAMSAEST